MVRPLPTMSDAMHAAIWAGDVSSIEQLIAAGADPCATVAGSGWSGLMLAAENAQVESIRVLLRLGADPTYALPDGWTALHHVVDAECDGAIQAGTQPDVTSLRLLVAAGADVAALHRGSTPADDAERRAWADGARVLRSLSSSRSGSARRQR